MYDVLIQCSSTLRLVPTGLLIDPEQANTLPVERTTLERCDACGRSHDWSRWSAILADAHRGWDGEDSRHHHPASPAESRRNARARPQGAADALPGRRSGHRRPAGPGAGLCAGNTTTAGENLMIDEATKELCVNLGDDGLREAAYRGG